MTPDAVGSFEPQRPLDLWLTLSALGSGPSLRHHEGALWRATRTPEGPVSVRLQRHDGIIDVAAWGAGAGYAVQHVPEWCGEDDDDSAFIPHHPLIAQLRREIRGLRMPRTGAVFEALVPAVILQQVTTVEARDSYHHLVNALGEPAPGPFALRLPPSPEVLANTPYWRFHLFGIERRRADIVVRAARSVKRVEETARMNIDSAYRRLLAFRGVGPWTAAKVAMVALGDADAVPVGDYHLPHSIGYAFDGTARSTDERMLEILEPYRGHRARVVRLVTTAGITAPRFGPKKPLRNLRAI